MEKATIVQLSRRPSASTLTLRVDGPCPQRLQYSLTPPTLRVRSRSLSEFLFYYENRRYMPSHVGIYLLCSHIKGIKGVRLPNPANGTSLPHIASAILVHIKPTASLSYCFSLPQNIHSILWRPTWNPPMRSRPYQKTATMTNNRASLTKQQLNKRQGTMSSTGMGQTIPKIHGTGQHGNA